MRNEYDLRSLNPRPNPYANESAEGNYLEAMEGPFQKRMGSGKAWYQEMAGACTVVLQRILEHIQTATD